MTFLPLPYYSLRPLKMLAQIAFAAVAMGSPRTGWKTCGGLADSYNRTACPGDASTCCTQKWMPDDGSWGCCPYANAVCCEGGYTCCPEGTTCKNEGTAAPGWREVSYCVSATGAQAPPGLAGGGQQ